jgi:hypothetical protein
MTCGAGAACRAWTREHLAKADSGTVPQIAKALRSDGEAVRYGLNVLRDEKIVRVTGKRQKATWSLAR